jgi:superoxide dismutase, Fe-Mn family
MEYKEKEYAHLIGIKGLSESLLRNHFTLYSGYVANTNKLVKRLAQLSAEQKTGEPEYAEIKRRFGWEWNGMRLHELYFEGLSTMKTMPGKKTVELMTQAFGSFESWERDYRSTGTMRGIGWVVLYLDQTNNQLFNAWIGEHDLGHPSGCVPLLIMDVFEHAYMIDYGLKKADYIAMFMGLINWELIEKTVSLKG